MRYVSKEVGRKGLRLDWLASRDQLLAGEDDQLLGANGANATPARLWRDQVHQSSFIIRQVLCVAAIKFYDAIKFDGQGRRDVARKNGGALSPARAGGRLVWRNRVHRHIYIYIYIYIDR